MPARLPGSHSLQGWCSASSPHAKETVWACVLCSLHSHSATGLSEPISGSDLSSGLEPSPSASPLDVTTDAVCHRQSKLHSQNLLRVPYLCSAFLSLDLLLPLGAHQPASHALDSPSLFINHSKSFVKCSLRALFTSPCATSQHISHFKIYSL